MNTQPTPRQAAEALRTIDQRTRQAVTAPRGGRWLDVLFGLVIFLYGASVDFLPNAAWPGPVVAALVVAYVAVLRTRRGAGLLGQSVRVHRQAISSRFVLVARLVIGVVAIGSMAAVVILGATGINTYVPYLSTILGGVLAVVLIAFGPWLRARIATAASPSLHGN